MAAEYHTASTATRLEECPASGAIHKFESKNRPAVIGQVIHVHMHERAAFGVDEAMARLPKTCLGFGLSEQETGILIARLTKYTFTPPAGSFGEVALCLRENGEVVRVKGGQGKYEDVPDDAICCGTLDAMWSEPEPLDLTDPEHPKCPSGSYLVVTDYKSGDEANVSPAPRNAQLAELTVMAAKWTGAREALPTIAFVREGAGEWDAPEVTWGPRKLAEAEERVRGIERRRRLQLAKVAKGEPPDVVEGPQCRHCQSASCCPAKLAMVKGAMGDKTPLAPLPLTEEQRTKLAASLEHLERFTRQARYLLKEDVDAQGPIDLGGGLFWGPVTETKDQIIASKAMGVLEEELGERKYDAIEVSKSGIEETVKLIHHEKGIKRQVSPTMRRIIAKLHEKEAIERVSNDSYKVHRPAPALPEADAEEEVA